MFYEPVKQDHGLPKNPFNSLVIPRPIGWITTVDPEGVVNLAPYSFFNAVGYRPPTVMFASGAGSGEDGQKDSLRNVEATGEFVCNLSTWETREAMNQSSASVGPEVDELEMSGLTPVPSKLVKPPRVKEAPVHLECKHLRSVDFPNWSNKDRYVVVFGEVIGVHIEDQYITPEGLIDVDGMKPIGRLGYDDYTIVGGDSIFTMTRPE
ncbi:MAG: flavin reductase family protein [SAR324 cluster bacterium]|nr:flavin reductase family protein [SAR324 cluster bacterium]